MQPGKVTMKLAPGVTMEKDGAPFTERVMGTDVGKRDWVKFGRATMHVIAREDRYMLRVANNESEVRKGFQGRVWYAPDPAYLVSATYLPYLLGRTVTIINALNEAKNGFAEAYRDLHQDYEKAVAKVKWGRTLPRPRMAVRGGAGAILPVLSPSVVRVASGAEATWPLSSGAGDPLVKEPEVAKVVPVALPVARVASPVTVPGPGAVLQPQGACYVDPATGHFVAKP